MFDAFDLIWRNQTKMGAKIRSGSEAVTWAWTHPDEFPASQL